MKSYALSAAVELAIDNYLKNLRQAFPSTPWMGVQRYAKSAWFAADEPNVPWDRVELHLKDAWSGLQTDIPPVLASAIPHGEIGQRQKSHLSIGVSGLRKANPVKRPGHQDAVTGAEFEEWSVGRRALQDQTKLGLENFRDPLLDYGSARVIVSALSPTSLARRHIRAALGAKAARFNALGHFGVA